jgi:chorismate mutase / prephenate dehydratase
VTDDPVLRELREQITAADQAILAAINTRIELVTRLKAHKDEHGLDFLDPEREERLLRHLEEMNPGPLSAEGVRELFTTILDLVKREL